MVEKFLFIANDKWFAFEQFMFDTKGTFTWFQVPRKVYTGAHVYFYLSGGTKAVKYEFVVIASNITGLHDSEERYKRYVLPGYDITFTAKPNQKWCQLQLVRVINNLSRTTPQALREHGKVLGSLMSNRQLKPFSISYLDGVL